MVNIKITTKGMHCNSCEMLVKDALEELAGVNKVEASHETGAIYIDFNDTKISKEKILDVIKEEGYTPQE
ncbi:heavy-metal-associated domain-containing protein [Candidatus Woesearchaeota archaeon]|jgi:copper chaperone|nr:heavy-metal-associated domain-containing protein [Candidatus Woesearchaeota archaeon]MBT4114329.1 heavy-metal-associated domain-containing protein [Candidatus Woesearchaeota archaeon]MBT4248618.1 heavy-metal-associated domain-containing protein [Candidatus Woesearchaeota archaeon]